MWDERYGKPGYAYGTEPNDFLREVADRIPDGPVLCLAEGEGRNAVFLAERGHAVTAVDSSAVGMDKAKKLAAERGVSLETVVADLADWDLGEARWSGIVAIFAHLPPQIRERVHRAAVRALAPGGAFVLEAYHPEQLEHETGGPPMPHLLYDLHTLEQELDGLQFDVADKLERVVLEGDYHTGHGVVVRLLGHKP